MQSSPQKSGLVWITGASTGIGRATALELARRGRTVVASARSHEHLESLVAESNRLGTPGLIFAMPLDVTDSAAVKVAVAQIEADHGPIASLFLNAGGWNKSKAGELTLDDFQATYDLNVFGVVRVLEQMLPRLKQRRSGHIAITASVAGYGGLPEAYGYCSSKAALINLAESLAIDLVGEGIKVQVVNPGFVRTPLTAQNKFPMPFLMEPEEAARRIADGFASNRFEITFPWQLVLPMKLARLFPSKLWVWGLRQAKKRGGSNF